MKLLACRHMWGVVEAWEVAVGRFASLGYGAIEMPMPGGGGGQERGRWVGLLNGLGLGYVPMAFTGAWDREVSVGEHVSSLREQVRLVKEIGREVEKGVPHVTVHSGRDWFTLKEAVEFYREAVRIEEGEGVVLAHETHRGRVFFNPWRTAEVLREVPGVKLCCDFSHWVVVAERLLGGCEAEIGLAAERCVHVHTRVGYGQGPQVPDPAAPEYAGAVAAHFGWWKTIWKSQRERGMKVSTFTPEFGPPEYLHTLPYTGVPVADLGRVCEWMRERVVGEFGE